MHYSQDNSYTRNIIDNSHNIDISKLPITKVIGQKIIEMDININYYYFYLKEGTGEINNLYFSGNGSSLIIYSEKSSGKINITSTFFRFFLEILFFCWFYHHLLLKFLFFSVFLYPFLNCF